MTNREYKKAIDTFLTTNWDFLYTCCKNILKGKNEDPNDLIAELTIYLYENKDKILPYISIEMLTGFAVSWCKLQSKYDTTPFMRKYKGRLSNDDVPDVIDESSDETDEEIKDLKKDFTDNQIDKIVKVKGIYNSLSEVNKILYDAYFIKGYSYEKIKDNYNFFRERNGKVVYYKSKKSIYNLMVELKNEIKSKL